MELRDRVADAPAARVEPRTVPDPVSRVHRIRPLRTEIRVPDDRRAASGGGAELLAVRVGASEAAVIRAVAFPNARDEERHRLWRTAASGLLRQHEIRAG